MSKSSANRVKTWRKATRNRIVASMGGCCVLCGYNKCFEALECHHIDPNEKEFGFGAIRANPKSWNKIVEELKKCVLLCANCHREYHHGDNEITFVSSFLKEEADKYYRSQTT